MPLSQCHASLMLRDTGLTAMAQLLRRLLISADVELNIPHDQWFRDFTLLQADSADGHFVAATSVLAMCMASSRLDIAIAGLFGAGKTRSAFLIIISLVAIDPSARSITNLLLSHNPSQCMTSLADL